MASLLLTLLVSFLLLHGSSTAPAHNEDVKDGSKPSLYSDGSTAPDGEVVLGDMLMSQDLYQTYFNAFFASPRKGVSLDDFLWPREAGIPTVPYVFQDIMYRREIEAGLRHWNEHTCLSFRPKEGNDINWLKFIYGQGCWAYIGKQQQYGGQEVSIGQNCQSLNVVVHEVGHAIGLFHEQMRSDRDDHVVINWQNVLDDQGHNFEKETNNEDSRSVPYDYTSIMHYEARGFSKNGRITIATKLPEHQGLLGRTLELTHRDKHIVNIMYGCIDAWKAKCPSTKSCEGEGYLGRDCTCVCPPGREGDRCEVKKGEYYDESLPACSTTITQEINFTSPNYPQNIPIGTWCVYKVEAPVGMVPEVIFHSFSFLTVPEFHMCTDFLEVRDSNLYDGGIYCARDIKNGQSFVSNSRHLYLHMEIFTPRSQGFQAEIVFHDANDAPKPKSEGVRDVMPFALLVLVPLLVTQVYGKS